MVYEYIDIIILYNILNLYLIMVDSLVGFSEWQKFVERVEICIW